jgi:transcriptional/translational regulatory protein YebC/TACO1
MAGVIPALLHLQEDAEAVNDISWQILNLALLQRLGEPSALPKLRNMLQHQQLTKVEKRYIKTLISKAEAGEEIKFSDIENLEYEN